MPNFTSSCLQNRRRLLDVCRVVTDVCGEIFGVIFIRQGLVSSPKGQVVAHPSVLPTHQMNSLELSGKSHLILFFPRLSHSSSPLLFLSTWSPLPLFSRPSASQVYLSFLTLPIVLFKKCRSLFIAIFLPLLAPPFPPTKALQRDHLSIKCRDMQNVEDTQTLLQKPNSLLLMYKHTKECAHTPTQRLY